MIILLFDIIIDFDSTMNDVDIEDDYQNIKILRISIIIY